MREFADENFKFDEYDGKFSKRTENTVGKGEIARYEQFLLFQQCFPKLVLQARTNQGLFGKGLKVTQNMGCFFKAITRRQNFRLVQFEKIADILKCKNMENKYHIG